MKRSNTHPNYLPAVVVLVGPIENGRNQRTGAARVLWKVAVQTPLGGVVGREYTCARYPQAVELMTKIAVDRNLKMRNEAEG